MNKLKNIIIFALLIFALIFVYCSFYVPFSQDEGVFLTISKGLLNGLLPYRDYFDHKPPSIYFLLLMPVKFFGGNLFGYRAFVLLINILTSFFVYKIADIYKKGSGFLAGVSYIFIVYIFEGYYLIAEPFLALFLSASFYLILKKHNSYNYLISGILIGIALFIKQPAVLSALPLVILAFFALNYFNILYFSFL